MRSTRKEGLLTARRVIDVKKDMTSASALYASDCRFEWGYDLDSGDLFDVKERVLARLEGCVFVAPKGRIVDPVSRATYLFAECSVALPDSDLDFGKGDSNPHTSGIALFRNCTLRRIDEDFRKIIGKGKRSRIAVEGGTAEYSEPPSKRPKSRPYSDLNPAWGRGNARR